MKKIRKTLGILMTILLLATLCAYEVFADSSGESEGTATVTSTIPEISGVMLNTTAPADANSTALTVNVQYNLNFTIADQNTMSDILNVTIRVWDTGTATENDTDDLTDHLTFHWVESTDTWTELPDGTWWDYEASNIDPGTGDGNSTYEFRLAFDLPKCGAYAGATTDWSVSIFVWDDSENPGSATGASSVCFGVAFYSEISITDATHGWSSLTPNTDDNQMDTPDADLDFTVIANADWDAQGKGNATELIKTGGGTPIGLDNVTIHYDTLGSSASLTTGYLDIGGLTGQSASTSETATATSCILWIDVPSGTEPGDYEYMLAIQIIQA